MAEVVSGGVIGLGITSRNISVGGAADATQTTEAEKRKKKPRKFIKNNTTK